MKQYYHWDKPGLIIFFFFTVLFPALLSAQSGTAFRDYNGNGIKDANEPGVKNITVKSFDINDAVYGTAVTNSAGFYTLVPAAATGQPLRVEFQIPSAATGFADAKSSIDFAGMGGSAYGSAVQFVTGNTGSINFAINNPADYFSSNAYFATATHITGNSQNAGGSAAGMASLLAYPVGMQDWADSDSTKILATQNKTGTVWGMAYSRQSKKIFSTAFLRRHAALGPLGLGGIYVTDISAGYPGTTGNFINLGAIGVNVGTVSSNEARGLPVDTWAKSYDDKVFDSVCKAGLGGIDMSEDGRYLYTINLLQKQLLKVDLQNAASPVVPAAAQVSGYNIPSTGCTGGVMRPFAVKAYRGNVYVGVVCDASVSKNRNDLKAMVYSFDPATAIFTKVLDAPLNYKRGVTLWSGYDTTWNAWSDTWPDIPDYYIVNSEPVLADIEFDADGSMVLDFIDRFSNQGAAIQPNINDPLSEQYVLASGDVLRANNNNGVFVLENNGTCNAVSGSGNNNGEGPGGGEYYGQDYVYGGTGSPYETVVGGLAIITGKSELHVLGYDVYSGNDNGTMCLNTKTGQRMKAYQVVQDMAVSGIGKGSGMGDLELIADAAPIEVGNRVWNDTDGDGIQDAGEAGINGVQVQLYDVTGTSPLATTTTSGNGNFYFSSNSFAGGLQPGTGYVLRIAASQYNNGGFGPLATLMCTLKDVNGNGQPDFTDNDAALVSGKIQVSFTTGGYGQNNHNIDFGFRPSVTLPLRLENFTAIRAGKKALLNWNTAAEEPATKFVVQRSLTGSNWSSIASVNGTGLPAGGTYTYTDEQPQDGKTNYYRLNITDITNSIKLSETRTVSFDKVNNISIFPNPSRELANISLPEKMLSKAIVIDVIDMNGRLLSSKKISRAGAVETLSLTGMESGNYTIKISFEGEIIAQPLFIL
jgi:hypothetical protein